jgi:hypothetical protein
VSARARTTLIVLVTALVAGGVGAGVVAIVSGGGDSESSTTAAGHTTTSSTTTPPTSTSTATATATATAPATTTQPPLSDAEAVLAKQGYQDADPATYDQHQSLAVLIGIRIGSADATAQRAFFFADGGFIGTDTSDDSAGVRVGYQRPPVIALQYALYRPKDPQCCATGGKATVRYQWNGTKLEPLDPIPPSSFKAALSRR